MDSPIHGGAILLAVVLLISSAVASPPALPSGVQINSNSVLVALLDSRYTELAELIEKALLLETLETAVGRHNLTVLAPRNEALERDLDPEFKRFLLAPANLPSLQTLILHHFLPHRIPSHHFPSSAAADHRSLSGEQIRLSPANIVAPDAVSRPDGVIHGVDRLLVPRSVQESFNRRRSLSSIAAVLPTGAPEVDPRTHRLKKPASPAPAGSPPALPVFDALAPGPSIAPAPAPGPGSGHRHFDGESQVKDFIQTLLLYGGYNEMADILVNLTSLASEMGRLVSEGYVITVLAPNDEAIGRLSADRLSEPGAPEQIMYYHMIPEYQTEESMYNAVRRFGKVSYETLRLPERVVAREADGSVKFGAGEGSAYLFDPDIYTDGRISVQGIDAILFPPEEAEAAATAVAPAVKKPSSVSPKARRGKLMEVTCQLLDGFGQRSRFTTCSQ